MMGSALLRLPRLTWYRADYEDLFYEQNKTATAVNVLAKSYRHVTLYNPGDYYLR